MCTSPLYSVYSTHQIRRIFLLMAHRVVSWSDNELCTSPVLSSATSIVSFDSTFSDTESDWKMSPTASEAHLPSASFEAKHTNLPKFLEEESTPRGRHTTPDKSFVRHDRYFFKDGNVTFLVCGLLPVLCIPDVLTSSHGHAHRLMVRCIASIDTSFFAIRPTSLRDLPSSAFATTKLYLPSYRFLTLNATISRHSSPSYTLRELC